MKTPMMTNLRARRGWTHTPCVHLLLTDKPTKSRYIAIDDGDRWDAKILNGDAEAIARAEKAFRKIRKLNPIAKIGWYGWPFPLNEADVARWGTVEMSRLIVLADINFPCCYSAGDGRAVERAKLADPMLVTNVPTVAFVCESLIDSSRFCTDDEIHEQCEAAHALGADSIYVWTGIAYRLWLMQVWRDNPAVCNDPDNPIYQTVRGGHADLLGLYGVGCDPMDKRSCDEAEGRYADALLGKFSKAWKDTK